MSTNQKHLATPWLTKRNFHFLFVWLLNSVAGSVSLITKALVWRFLLLLGLLVASAWTSSPRAAAVEVISHRLHLELWKSLFSIWIFSKRLLFNGFCRSQRAEPTPVHKRGRCLPGGGFSEAEFGNPLWHHRGFQTLPLYHRERHKWYNWKTQQMGLFLQR